MKEVLLNEMLKNDYSSKDGTMCIVVHWDKIRCADSVKEQNKVSKWSNIVQFVQGDKNLFW